MNKKIDDVVKRLNDKGIRTDFEPMYIPMSKQNIKKYEELLHSDTKPIK